jgi:hypothetical protein
MPKNNEFTLHIDDRPGTLGKCCRALAEQGINIVAFSSFPGEGQSTVRMVVDNPSKCKTVLDAQHIRYNETEVALVRLAHRPGELGRAATRLGEENINISYAYCGAEPGTNAPIVVFGVREVGKAATLLEEVALKAA